MAMIDFKLREVTEADLPILFEHQQDSDARRMAAFTSKDPADWAAFAAKWAKILGDPTAAAKVVVHGERVVGMVGTFIAPWSGQREVTYWIGREYWGQGLATRALTEFIAPLSERPLYGRAAADNRGSIRVLEKCGFVDVGRERAFAEARGEEIDEVVMELRAGVPNPAVRS